MQGSHSANSAALIGASRQRAESLLRGVGDRWLHVQGVVSAATTASLVLDEHERPYLLAAAYLHDIGYAPDVVVTGFHALDGAQYVLRLGEERRICCLVAHHSAARGVVRDEIWELLAEAKLNSQETDEAELIQFPVSGQVFLLKPYGLRGYTYWLTSPNSS